MARGHWAKDLYVAAEAFVERCLRQGCSLVDQQIAAWTPEVAGDLYHRLVVNADEGPGGFLEKLQGQLRDAPREPIVLATDLVYLYYLPIHDITYTTRRSAVGQVLGLLEEPPPLESSLDKALHDSLASYGQAKAAQWKHVRYLAEFARAWTGLTGERREELLADPWAFKEYLAGVSNHSPLEAGALQHLVFPDVFESIVSAEMKTAIAGAFPGISGVADEPDVDRKLALIRPALEPVLGSSFTFYGTPVEPVWKGKADDPAWTFARFARRFRESPGFDAEEVSYKRELSGRLAEARRALLAEENWIASLKKAFTAPNNNITSHFDHVRFIAWCEESPSEAQRALRELWSPDEPNLEGFLSDVPDDVLRSPGGRANMLSYLLGARGAEQWVTYKPTQADRALELCGRETADAGDVLGRLARFTEFVDELRVRVVALGGRATTRLEGQGMAWAVVANDAPPEWTEDERNALAAFRGASITIDQPERPLAAWYVRDWPMEDGSHAVDHWLSDGFVSTYFEEVGAVDTGASMDEIRDRVRDAFPEDDPSVLKFATGTLYSFATRMRVDDLVVARAGSSVFVGRVAGDSTWKPESHRWLRRRRDVEWLNREQPASRDELSPALVTSLKTPHAVSKIASVDEVASLVGLAEKREVPEAKLAPVTPEVAKRVFFDVQELQSIVDLLGDKRQLVFFGPPGTGKTLIAKRLAEHLTSAGGEWHLVQFHPSYAYEDFMEGYRPDVSPDGAVRYKLRLGPFRRIAEDARTDPANPYVLVVDEINRGNIPKIFGELLFLLEYRDEPVALQYSEEFFSLPPNLYLIGTMNTADRSIALVDAALRRRFYFVPFLPRQAPVSLVLRRWLQENERDDRPAKLLDALNEKIAKDEIAIGPSYLMTGDGSDESLQRIWDYAIMPLLEEHFYATKHDVEKEFGLNACLAMIEPVVEPGPRAEEEGAAAVLEPSGDGRGDGG